MNDSLMTGVLEHLGCFLSSGSGRAARRAIVLLERLARDPQREPRVREQGLAMAEIIDSLVNAHGRCL